MHGRAFFLFFLFWCAATQAGIQFDSTRIIYPAAKREITLALTNNASTPRLLQAWMDNGDPTLRPDTSTVPFIVTPPVFRLNAAKGQTLRIRFIGGNVPQERESVFWLNVLEVQPKTKHKANDDNVIQFPVRSRLKLFYRPTGLLGTPGDAVKALRWRLVSEAGQDNMECENPSAFSVSFARISLSEADEQDEGVTGMCPAKGRYFFTLPGTGQGKIYYTTINDHGGFTRHHAVYSH
ncbi:TPA: molecular chaperone [Kluyvera intermedia]|uniref:Molecular chaperone n=1 Tax=Kluyvera intermedia TaxID=61648 RepID=A0A9P3WHW3_KLUIN|nr:molecular chaperone [Phytobacter ursingii]HAT2206337.1 molecular chaperone [Kluyvera intermedia]HAT2517011.1 molecular chaperone [Kluyvera intermedia]HAT2605519.1 molecular chaperone [Kluyvera intermedia]HAT2682350.1 molecular chaperone [Kluyvera intermedia]HAT2698902.1 molecular chaperone [Kluyvera intermedia]